MLICTGTCVVITLVSVLSLAVLGVHCGDHTLLLQHTVCQQILQRAGLRIYVSSSAILFHPFSFNESDGELILSQQVGANV